jgi:hypothetical protein
MTKLTYDYDSPENNAKVLKARAQLAPEIGGHLEPRSRERILYREGYAVAKAFGFTFAFGMEEDSEKPYPYLQMTPTVKLSILQRPNDWWSTAPQDHPYRAFRNGVTDGASDHPASLEAEAKFNAALDAEEDEPEEEICKTCYMARELHDYMTFRAKREGVGHTLVEDHYRQVLHAGAAGVFGVTFDIDKGLILADSQNPEALEVWLRAGAVGSRLRRRSKRAMTIPRTTPRTLHGVAHVSTLMLMTNTTTTTTTTKKLQPEEYEEDDHYYRTQC